VEGDYFYKKNMKRSSSLQNASGSGSGVTQDRGCLAAVRNYYSSRPIIQLMKAHLILLAGGLMAGFCLVLADYRRPMSGTLKEDVVHTLVPEIKCLTIINISMMAALIITVIYILFDQRRRLIIKRFMVIYAICLVLRNISMVVTSLPDPSPRCKKDRPLTLNFSIKNMIISVAGGLTCGDMIFSGHFMAFILPATIHGHFYGNWFSVVLYINAAIGFVLIIVSRLHYTVDTVISLFICTGVSWLYNLIAENENEFSNMPSLIVMYMRDMEWSDGFQALHQSRDNVLE
jgi:hypothetical protein